MIHFRRMARTPKHTNPRPRTIRWSEEIDKIATDLAFEKKFKGGVSELLMRLVKAEFKRKRGIAHLA